VECFGDASINVLPWTARSEHGRASEEFAMIEVLEARQLLAAALHAAVHRVLAHPGALVVLARHHVRKIGPPTPVTNSSAAPDAIATVVTAVVTTAVAPASVTPSAQARAGLNDAVYHGNAA